MGTHHGNLRTATVRICDSERYFWGLGYRITHDLVITCAHVVAQALDVDPEQATSPADAVLINAPFLQQTGARDLYIEAHVVPSGWFPRRESGLAELTDLAVLRLRQSLPGRPATLDAGLSLAQREFIAYGGIAGHREDLVPIGGHVREAIANGRYVLGPDHDSAYWIEDGCSGAPVCDLRTGAVVGLVVQTERDPGIKAGFLIPAAHLEQALNKAKPTVPIPACTLEPLRHWVDQQVAPLDYLLATQCKRFIDHYAGTRDAPMPFTGRAEELNRLNDVLTDDGDLLLVRGRAGMGKSALLLHWTADLLATDREIRVLFLPLSIRFETSDELRGLRLLYTQLAALFSELRFNPEARPDATDYRSQIHQGWRVIADCSQRRFLLVIDGVDEAVNTWVCDNVLPYEISPNLKIVLAARDKPGDHRDQSWLGDFRLAPQVRVRPPLELVPLTMAAVGEAVAQLGCPLDALVEGEAVLDALYRLTDQGDPLLVNLWVRQLWNERDDAARYTAAELNRMKPSFIGFLDVWIKEQQEIWKSQRIEVHPDDFERLMRVFSLAHGPLPLEDLLALLQHLDLPVQWDYGLARKILESASRLVVGAGDGRGYSFVHPRLGDHYRAQIQALKAERQSVPNAFLTWGAETVRRLNTGDLPPENCPRYLLRHYVAHVEAAGLDPEEALDSHLLPLLGGGWHRAWYEEEGAYGGYLGDLRAVQETLRKANVARGAPPYRIVGELRCTLIRASIFELTDKLPPALIVKLVDGGEWTAIRGLTVARNVPDPRGRIAAFVGLANLSQARRLRQQALREALAATETISPEDGRAEALAAVAKHLAGEQRRRVLEQALATAQTIQNEWQRAHALAAVARQLAGEPNLLDQALAAAEAIQHEEARAHALAAVKEQMPGQPDLDLLGEILATAQAMPTEWTRSHALAAVAKQLAGEQRRRVLEQALATAQTIQNEWQRAHALAAVARQLAGEPNLLDQALATAQTIQDEQARTNALLAVLSHLVEEQRRHVLKQALVTAQAIGDQQVRVVALAAVAKQLAGEQRQHALEQALATAQTIQDEGARGDALALVAEQLAGERDLLGKIFATAQTIQDQGKRARTLAAVARQLAGEPNLLDQALATAQTIQDEQARTNALAAAKQMGKGPALRNQALVTLQAIRDKQAHVDALAAVARHLTGEQRRRVLEQALATAQTIRVEWMRARPLAAVAEQMAGEPHLLREALAAAEAIQHEEARAHALAAVAKHLAGEQRRRVLEQALATVQAIRDERGRARALASVAEAMVGEPDLLGQALTVAERIRGQQHRTLFLQAIVRASPSSLPYSHVAYVLDTMVPCRRRDWLELFRALLPAIAPLGGEDAMWEMTSAIIDTANWWP